MDRRNFFKILSTVSAGAAATSCGTKRDALAPLLVPEHEIVPGVEQWHVAVCRECAAGCGVIARVMEGERTVERNGQKFRERVAAIKKLEGNPLDPVSGGRLCARGQAAVQGLYHPDRVRGPLKRTGARGEAKFAPVAWDEAIAGVVDKLKGRASDVLFLTAPEVSARTASIARFVQAIGAPAARTCSLQQPAGLPRYDLARARYVLGVGADFLGTWASPVYYMRQYGEFRQGRPGVRGHFVQADSRMSLTASNADEWVPIQPGSERAFLAAIGAVLRGENPKQEWLDACGVTEKRVRRIAEELKQSEAPLVIAADTEAALYVNGLLGNFNKPGGVFGVYASLGSAPQKGDVRGARVLLVDAGENPAYLAPGSLANVETIISFSPFLDDTAAQADWILPDHHALESDMAIEQPVSPKRSVAVGTAFVKPLYDTRAVEQTLADVAKKMSVAYAPVTPEEFAKPLLAEGESWEDVVRRGGVQADAQAGELKVPQALQVQPVERSPLVLQTYLSTQYYDGRAANLPWMQELPDPASSAMWDLPVEIDPKTASSLQIASGDRVGVESERGAIEVFAYVHPAAIPGVVSMAIGEGHAHFTRYASGRGANPLTVADAEKPMRVKISRIAGARGELAQFSPQDREQGPWGGR
ncbi:MAG TPA: molybdopterin dinucleotide binding domain-containing protein [Bryobacteraceae bacterium]|jgi:anaerobic selenocysteine-containing dehydrogenase|nr:molybdopterin dinucleotide binding domain-containing protein [Bryobacteraceae bacterium]